MDKSLQTILRKRAERTVNNLKRNHFDARYVETAGEAVRMVSALLQPDTTVAFGGSMTLQESGVMAMLRQAQVPPHRSESAGADTRTGQGMLSCRIFK